MVLKAKSYGNIVLSWWLRQGTVRKQTTKYLLSQYLLIPVVLQKYFFIVFMSDSRLLSSAR